jgi:Domain of unknown function (DUF1707)
MDTPSRNYPPDDQRVSDANRDHAVSELSEAFQAGRITADEFEQRSGRALSARTGKELTDLFTDLQKDNVPAARTAAGRLASPRAVGTWIALGASGAAAASLAFLTLVNALTAGTNPGLTLPQRETRRALAEQVLKRQGISISVPLPPGRCLRHRLGRHSNASGHHRPAHRADRPPLARDPRPPRLGLRWVGCYRGLFGLRVFARPVVRVVFLESRAALLAFPYSAGWRSPPRRLPHWPVPAGRRRPGGRDRQRPGGGARVRW